MPASRRNRRPPAAKRAARLSAARAQGADPCLERSALQWVRRVLGDNRHERQVRVNAQRLFDRLGASLRLGPADNRWLRLAAVLHDVGRSESEKHHPQAGAKLVLAADFNWSAADRRAVAYLTRYHRSGPPDRPTILKPADPAGRLRRILGLLEAADVLDSRRLAKPSWKLIDDGETLTIDCRVTGPLEVARRVYARPKKFATLAREIGKPVRVVVRH